MKKSLIRSLIAIAIVMVVLPVAILFTPADTGMTLCMILFLAINPVFFLGLGIYAGEQVQEIWFVPLIAAGIYLVLSWLMFGLVAAFLLYAAFYLVLGYGAMGIRWLIAKKTEKRWQI